MVRPLQYNSGLSYEEAERRYSEVRCEFKIIRKNYVGLLGKLKTHQMQEGDKKTLADCVGVLLPLALEASVQQQAREAKNLKKTLSYDITGLTFRILDFSTNFENTGVRRFA